MTQKMTYPWLPYFLMDLLSITAAYYLTILIRFHSDFGRRFYDRITIALLEQPAGKTGQTLETFYYASAFRIVLILTAVIGLLYALRHLYAGRRYLMGLPVVWNVLVSNLIALAIFYVYWYLTRNTFHPRSLFATLIFLNVLLCPLLRFLMQELLRIARKKWGVDRCAALLAGSGPAADFLQEYLTAIEPHGLYCARRMLTRGQGQDFSSWLEEMRGLIRQGGVDALIVADSTLTVPQIMQIIELTADADIVLKLWSDHLEVVIKEAKLPCDVLFGTPLVHFNGPLHRGGIGIIRRGITVVLSLLLLIVLAPVLLLLAVMIRLTSPGPVIFKQKRIGINRKPFYIYKFRTMREMAEEELASIEAENESKGPLFKIRRDPRVTPLGRFLRRFSLDELPQLLNVVKGDMALVGPRPLPDRDFARYEEDWHYVRHGGLPGLTCLWQISGRSNLDFHHMCILDVYYLRNHTWIMDVSIALQTVRTVVFGIGAY